MSVSYAEMNEYEQASTHSQQCCLRICGAIHGEEHILYAQTIQKMSMIFRYEWSPRGHGKLQLGALDVMHIGTVTPGVTLKYPNVRGCIHYSKVKLTEAYASKTHLRSKQVDLGEDHPSF
jgi:hypothetical protein